MRAVTIYEKDCWEQTGTDKEINEETGREELFRLVWKCEYSTTLCFYNNITRGRAKRIARNHYLRFRPSDCGMGFKKMKDKKYLPSAKFVYTSHNRRLFIRINGTFKRKLISKTLIED